MKKNLFETIVLSENTIHDTNDPAHTEPNRTITASQNRKTPKDSYKSRLTKRGMRLQLEHGYWPYKAPRGYSNGIMNGKRIIFKNTESLYISWAFADFSSGLWSLNELQSRCKRIGFTISENALKRLLKNPIYCGMIKLPATDGQPETLIKGNHKAIITKTLFKKVQRVWQQQEKQRTNNRKQRTKSKTVNPLKNQIKQ